MAANILTQGIAGLATPVRQPDGTVVGAINVATPAPAIRGH